MRLSVFHLVLFLNERGSFLVGKLHVRPATIGIASGTAVACLRLERVVNEMVFDVVLEFASVDSLKVVVF